MLEYNYIIETMEDKKLETTKTLLNFLEQSELDMFDNAKDINTKIQDNFTKQKEKQTQISKIKEEVSKISIPALNKKNKKETYISELNEISKSIKSNTNDLSSLKDFWKKSTKEFSKFKHNPNSERASTLKNMLSNYKDTLANIEFNISTTDNTIEDFIKELAKVDNTLNFIEKVSPVEDDSNIVDNNTLIISERENCVFLPY